MPIIELSRRLSQDFNRQLANSPKVSLSDLERMTAGIRLPETPVLPPPPPSKNLAAQALTLGGFSFESLGDFFKPSGTLDQTLQRLSRPFVKGATEVFVPNFIESHENRMLQNARNSGNQDRVVQAQRLQNANTTYDKVGEVAGSIAGYVAPSAAAYRLASMIPKIGATGRTASQIGLGRRVGELAREGAAAGAILTGGELARDLAFNPENANLSNVLTNLGINVAGGAILDPAIHGVGAGFKHFLRNTPKQNALPNEILQLPEGQSVPQIPSNLPVRREPVAFIESPPVVEFKPSVKINDISVGDRVKVTNNTREFNVVNIDPSTNKVTIKAPSGKEKVIHKSLLESRIESVSTNTGDLKVVKNGAKGESIPTPEEYYKSTITADDIASGKDIGKIARRFQDVYRNFRDFFGDNFAKAKEIYLDPLDKAKGDNIRYQEKELVDFDNYIIKQLKIKPNTEKSALVQKFGEGRVTREELVKQRPDDYQSIIEADKWFRERYDKYIEEVNTVLRSIGEPEVAKRPDYYRHFQDLEGLAGLKHLFETPAGVDIDPSTQMRVKGWVKSFMKKREEHRPSQITYDAVRGYLDYLPSASYVMHINPHAKRLSELSARMKKDPNAQEFHKFLNEYAETLSGMPTSLDRGVMDFIGHKTYNVANYLNKQARSNAILGNLGTVVTQIGNIPQFIGHIKANPAILTKGTVRAVKSIGNKKQAMYRSDFLKERYHGKMYRKYDTGVIKNAKNFAGAMLESVDKMTTSVIWNSIYDQAISSGIKNPIKHADDITRALVGGRGVGEKSLLQQSRTYQLADPFTLEVTNLLHSIRDMKVSGNYSKILYTFGALYVTNKIIEEIRGSRLALDPIQAGIDAGQMVHEGFQEGELGRGLMKGAGRLVGEAVSNMPLGTQVARWYPEQGTDWGLPSRRDFFGDSNPIRFGSSGYLLADAFQNPLTQLALPFGGAQVRKTGQAIDDIQQGMVINEDSGRVRHPIDNEDLSENIRQLLFGRSTRPEVQQYFDEGRNPLGTVQSQQYLDAVEGGADKFQLYDQMRLQSDVQSLERRINNVAKDQDLTQKEKERKINKLIEDLNALFSN